MVSEVGQLGVSILMVYNISRLTRGGMIDLWELVKKLDEQGVRIFNCQSGMFVDPDDDASALVASVEASQAKASNKQLAKDITRTMIANVRDRR